MTVSPYRRAASAALLASATALAGCATGSSDAGSGGGQTSLRQAIRREGSELPSTKGAL